jgi:hypothetical protein
MAIPRTLLQTTAADIAGLITEEATEGPHVDFKRDLPGSDGSSRHELLADVSAFANSSGGDLIYGIDEDGEARATAVFPATGNADAEARRIQDVLMNGLEPRAPGIQVHPVDVEGGFVVIVRVPQSWAAPHRVRTNQHFFVREGRRKRQLDVPEVRGLFLRSEHQAQRVRDFRTERLGKLVSGAVPVRLVEGPLLVVHLVPTQGALGLLQLDPVTYARERHLPALGTTLPGARLNIDGALSSGIRRKDGIDVYSQLFRDGFFETVQVLTRRTTTNRFNLASTAYEKDVITLVERFRSELEYMGAGQEMTCMLSLTDAVNVELGLSQMERFMMLDEQQGFFDRSTLVLPDVLLPADVSAGRALRPVFDLVWQSAGLEGSRNYNGEGNWVARQTQ